MGNSTRRPKMGDRVDVYIGEWAGHSGTIRDVLRGKVKVAIDNSIIITYINTDYVSLRGEERRENA